MISLSKNTFKFHITKEPLPRDTVSLFNNGSVLYLFDYSIHEKINFNERLNLFKQKHGKSPEKLLTKTKQLEIGHGSLLKAEIFNNHEKYIPNPIYYLLSEIENVKVINKELIETVNYCMSAKNTSNYYLINNEYLLTILKAYFNHFLYFTYC